MQTMKMSEGGRVVVPIEIRRALELNDGDPIYWRIADGEAVLSSGRARIRRAQERIRRHLPEGTSLVADLITDRRAESARE